MSAQINQILDSEQLSGVLETLFINRPIRIIRAIARTGKNQIVWVHLENEITGDRRATFLSFESILSSFWNWLESANLLLMSLFQVNAIGQAVYNNVREGDRVWAKNMGWVEVLELDITEGLGVHRFWVDFAGSLAQLPASSVKAKS